MVAASGAGSRQAVLAPAAGTRSTSPSRECEAVHIRNSRNPLRRCESLCKEAFMSSPRNQNPETRGIDWIAIERIFVLQVLALLALAGAFIGYVNWSSGIAFAEFSAASNRAALQSEVHPGYAPAVQAGKRQVPGGSST